MGNWNLLKNLLIEENVLSQKEAVSSVENTVIMQVVDRLVSSTKIEKALRILDGAIQCQDQTIPLYQKKSQILLQEGYIDNAIHELKNAYSKDTTNVDLILEIIDTYRASEDYDGGIQFTNECLEYDLYGLELEVLLSKVQLLRDKEDIDGCFDLIIKLIFDNPKDLGVINTFNSIVQHYRLYDEAIGVLEDVIEEAPYSEQVWYSLGHLYYYNCRFPQARMAYEYAFIIDPMFEDAYRHYVSVAMDTLSYKKALKAYAEMIEKFTLDTQDILHIAQCYIHFKDYKRAIQFLEHGLRKERRSADLYYMTAQVYFEQENFSFCANYLNKAIRIDNENETYHLLKACILYRQDQLDQSLAAFKDAVDLAPMLPSTWESYIQLLISDKNYDLALEILDEAVMESGSSKFAYYEALCHIGLEESSKGLKCLELALEDSFEEHEVIFELFPELHGCKKIKAMIAYYLFDE